MTQAFRQLGAEFRRDWNDGLNWECKRSAIAFVVLTILAFAACRLSPALLDWIMQLITGTLAAAAPSEQAAGLAVMLTMLVANIQSCSVTMLYGMIPWLYLPAVSLGLNSMLLGVMAAWYLSAGYSALFIVVTLLFNLIFELPALILSFAAGLFVCGQITRRIRGDETARSAIACLMVLSRTLVLLLPLLVLSSAAQAFLAMAAIHLS